jgi:hypothetical protein
VEELIRVFTSTSAVYADYAHTIDGRDGASLRGIIGCVCAAVQARSAGGQQGTVEGIRSAGFDEEIDITGGALDAVKGERESSDQRDSETMAARGTEHERDRPNEWVPGARPGCHETPLVAPRRIRLNLSRCSTRRA